MTHKIYHKPLNCHINMFHQYLPSKGPIKMSHQNIPSKSPKKCILFFFSTLNFSTVVLLKSSTVLHYSDYIWTVLDVSGLYWGGFGTFWDILCSVPNTVFMVNMVF